MFQHRWLSIETYAALINHNNIDYAEELLNIKATRSSMKDLNVMLPSLSKETTTANTRKRKAPQNHENSEHSSIEASPF
jgi:hypothetical protein